MDNMQQDAVRRMKEMQARAKVKQSTPSENAASDKAEHSAFEEVKKTDSPQTKGSVVDDLFKDKEKTLILALIALLTTEKADASLVLALMYLLM